MEALIVELIASAVGWLATAAAAGALWLVLTAALHVVNRLIERRHTEDLEWIRRHLDERKGTHSGALGLDPHELQNIMPVPKTSEEPVAMTSAGSF